MRTRITVLLLLLTTFTGTWLLAQSEPESTPEPEETISCEPGDLVDKQLELITMLDSFQTDLVADPQQALGAMYEVGAAFQEIALTCGYIPANIGELTVGTDIERIMTVLETLRGDPFRGQLLYNSVDTAITGALLGCSSCHIDGTNGPLLEETWDRAVNERLQLDQFAGYTPEQYIIESIIHPGDYIVPEYSNTLMPPIFSEALAYQDLADVLAFLQNQTNE